MNLTEGQPKEELLKTQVVMFRHDHLAMINQAITFVLFVGAFLASSIAILETEATENQSEVEDVEPR